MTSERPSGFFGARFSLYPMTDHYVPVVLAAIEGLQEGNLEIDTDDVSTFIGGDRDAIFASLERIFATAARGGEHVVMTALLSHGCPGEEVCEPAEASPERPTVQNTRTGPSARGTGIDVSCQWSLYPLGVPGYMDAIYRAIALTKQAGIHEAGRHFVSHLRGDLGHVLETIRRAFDDSCRTSAHVTAHLVLSANSPTPRGDER
ncbi:MAG: YkoF family thiamine/hydroxymethylpyrimidine-binding protein [Candidatus Limnocylindria bacterium]